MHASNTFSVKDGVAISKFQMITKRAYVFGGSRIDGSRGLDILRPYDS